MSIKGFLKTSFIDYPDLIASVIFLGGCNYRCPFCHNGDLVFDHEMETIQLDTIVDYLNSRSNIVDGLVITGGEPTLYPDLIPMLKSLRRLDIKIKLDTNGSNSQVLSQVIEADLVDYIAMDVKNSKEKYLKTIGLNIYNSKEVYQSIKLICQSGIDHEFRTTIVKGLHEYEDVLDILNTLEVPNKFVMQQYSKSDKELINNEFECYTMAEMGKWRDELSVIFSNTTIQLKGRF